MPTVNHPVCWLRLIKVFAFRFLDSPGFTDCITVQKITKQKTLIRLHECAD